MLHHCSNKWYSEWFQFDFEELICCIEPCLVFIYSLNYRSSLDLCCADLALITVFNCKDCIKLIIWEQVWLWLLTTWLYLVERNWECCVEMHFVSFNSLWISFLKSFHLTVLDQIILFASPSAPLSNIPAMSVMLISYSSVIRDWDR